MDVFGILGYLALLAAAALVVGAARLVRVPGTLLALAVGLVVGRAGFDLLPIREAQRLLPALTVHLGLALGVLGHRLGRGLLRLPPGVVLRRSLPPAALVAASLLLGTALLPRLLAGAEPDRSFGRFLLPLAFVFAAFPLLSLRDLRGRTPADAGSLYLAAALLIGAVYSFTPPLLWMRPFDPGMFWRGPVLILGESGALGVAVALLGVALVRRLRVPGAPVALLGLVALVALSFRLDLWLPFAALGAGILLGRVGVPDPRLPRPGLLFTEAPFLLLGGAVFAPDLFRETVGGPALVHAAWLVALVLAIRARVPGGKALVTGPGFLFLGFALAIRLDGRMGPLTRYTIDFALPAWVAVRAALRVVRRVEGADTPPAP